MEEEKNFWTDKEKEILELLFKHNLASKEEKKDNLKERVSRAKYLYGKKLPNGKLEHLIKE